MPFRYKAGGRGHGTSAGPGSWEAAPGAIPAHRRAVSGWRLSGRDSGFRALRRNGLPIPQSHGLARPMQTIRHRRQNARVGQTPFRRPAAAAFHRSGADSPAGGGLFRRTDHRAGREGPARGMENPGISQGEGADHLSDFSLHGRSGSAMRRNLHFKKGRFRFPRLRPAGEGVMRLRAL